MRSNAGEDAMPSTLITGANRGIGLEFARQYFADGWQVYAACRDPSSATELRRLANPSDQKLQIMALDVTDATSIKAAATELDGQAIDLLLNNAGVMGPRGQTIGNIDYDAWAKVLDANTMGPMRVSEAFVDQVARSARKLIVTLTSGMGSLADNIFRRFDRLSQLEGGGEHGDAQSGHRPRTTRYHVRGRQSWLGANRHGWASRQNKPDRERHKAKAFDRHFAAGAVGRILQL